MRNNKMDRNDGNKLNIKWLLALLLLLVIVGAGLTAAWITQNKETNTDNIEMSLMVEQEDFDLAAVGENAGTYREILAGLGVSEEGTDFTINTKTGKSTKNKSAIYWNVNEDSHINNITADGKIAPGSEGVLTFYVISNKTGQLDITLTIGTEGFKRESESTVSPSADDINALLNGHILFFKTKTAGKYSEYLAENKYGFSESNAVEGEAYECTIYWYWPLNVNKMILDSDKVDDDAKEEIIDEMISDVEKITDEGYHSRFFKHANPSAMKAIVTEETMGGTIADNVIKTVSACYNQGDQKIALNADYLLLRLGVWGETEDHE